MFKKKQCMFSNEHAMAKLASKHDLAFNMYMNLNGNIPTKNFE